MKNIFLFSTPLETKDGGLIYGKLMSDNDSTYQVKKFYQNNLFLKEWFGETGREWLYKYQNHRFVILENYDEEQDVLCFMDDEHYYNLDTIYPKEFEKTVSLDKYKYSIINFDYLNYPNKWFDENGYLIEDTVYHHLCNDFPKWELVDERKDLPF